MLATAVLVDDFEYYFTGKVKENRAAPMSLWEHAAFWLGKGIFITLAFAVPSIVDTHSFGAILLKLAIAYVVVGAVHSTLFQVRHACSWKSPPCA